MPELPEVENVKTTLMNTVKGKTITHVTIFAERIIRTPDVDTFCAQIKGKTIHAIERRGKHLLFILDNAYIVSHLRMEGKYHFIEREETFNKHDHVIFHFSDHTQLRYNDVRKFGTMDLVQTPEEVKSVKELGLEPADQHLTGSYIHKALLQKKTTVKNALLDQRIIAGLGNIYADEVCYAARIHPKRTANTLTLFECEALCEEIKRIISLAIEQGGSSIRTYDSMGKKGSMQDFHEVYNKKGSPCKQCATPIEKIQLHGRGTHFCPTCQQL